MDTHEIIDVRAIEPGLRHAAIFEKFDSLNPGRVLVIRDDHDPGSFYDDLQAKRGAAFQWETLKNGPLIWQIKVIKKDTNEDQETIGSIVSLDYRKARVLKSLDIDFICNGNRTLQQACDEKKLPYIDVRQLLFKTDSVEPDKGTNYSNWDLAFLTKYIIEFHHRFVSMQTGFITSLAYKAAESDRVHHPEIKRVADLFAGTGRTLELKGIKEERTWFPYITALCAAYKNETTIREADFGPVSGFLHLTQAEGRKVLEDFRLIRQQTNDYTAPAYTSNACAILYKLLAAYEEDIYLHLHLENNILFPKAIEMEALMRSGGLITR
ncbi:regulator of cell morphogenesis and NO signaling [Mucilaginibacter sp. OK268]|uniref:DUF542 domain-containing protein n=1 Tax=Mucilaginibacter sp. OK268 TaxID=1881048 RepID=UPI00087FB591|nr:DUF542 domain-containing protein [Mucilaginibacter sp. OK268]SDP97026.1 regulator of cell morphogenesis and NO signaling [Mucilaginibacter sp. OK268]